MDGLIADFRTATAQRDPVSFAKRVVAKASWRFFKKINVLYTFFPLLVCVSVCFSCPIN